MDQRLNIVTLGVKDLAKSRQFYEDGLGWKRSKASNDAIAFYQVGSSVFALFGRAALAEDAHLKDSGGWGAVTLAQNVRTKAEVDAVLAQAKAAGATVLQPPHDAFWGGYTGYFADPDGHAWEVAWNPHFTLSEDGAVQLP